MSDHYPSDYQQPFDPGYSADHRQIEEWILDFGLHGVEERRRVESFVQNHPEWAPCFRIAQEWESLLRDARRLGDPGLDDEHLPYAVASRTLPNDTDSGTLGRLMDRIFNRSEVNPDRRMRRTEYQARRNESDATTNVARHFEQVTGHLIREAPAPREVRRVRGGDSGRRGNRFDARPRAAIARQFARTIVAAAGVYLLLFSASTLREAPIERMAHLNAYDYSWTGLGVSGRGNDAAWEQLMVDRYDEALAVAASAHRSFLGLFPSYRADKIRTARDLLQESIDFQLAREPVPPHAYLTLAKLHFLLGDTLSSLDALREVILQNEDRVQRPGRPVELY